MCNAIQQRRLRIAKHLHPRTKQHVRGKDHIGLLKKLADEEKSNSYCWTSPTARTPPMPWRKMG